MIARRRLMLLAALAAGSLVAAAAAGAATTGTTTAQSGFNVENLLMELSVFLPEEYAGFYGDRGFLVGRPGGAAAGGEAPGNQPQGSQGTQSQGGTSGQPGTQGGQRPQGFDLPQFKRDAKLMLTAKQVEALVPVLLDLQKTPYPTPSQAKKVTTTVDATLTKQQKDAYDKYVKERDKAMEEMRKQFASRSGSTGTQDAQGSGTGGFVTRNNDGTGQGGQAGQGQRQQVDPAELRKQMLETFIKNLQDYRKGLK